MEKVLYSKSMGEGIICEGNEILGLSLQSPIVADEILVPGTYTSMSGFFAHSLLYMGMLDKTSLVFYIGDATDSLGHREYYQVVHLLGNKRLFSMYSHQGGRDFNYVNNKWK